VFRYAIISLGLQNDLSVNQEFTISLDDAKNKQLSNIFSEEIRNRLG
jgi:hypothetical protein